MQIQLGQNPYHSVHEFFLAHKLQHRQFDNWRLTKPCLGSINGLPNLRGFVLATNGILCYLENERGEICQGHFDWFNPEQQDAVVSFTDGTPVKESQKKGRTIDVAKLLIELEI
jgi:hypothetical protein